MLPKNHILINLIISLILLIFFKPFFVLVFFLAAILIDADHYFYYIIEEKDFSFKRAYKWFVVNRKKFLAMSREERKKHKNWFLIFHGVEVLIILFISSQYYPIVYFVFFGFLAHLIQDMFEDIPLGVAERKLFLSYAIYKHFQHKRRLKNQEKYEKQYKKLKNKNNLNNVKEV